MAIVGAFDLHRAQNTGEWVDTETGELTRFRIGGTRADLAVFLDQFPADADVTFAFEGCTGWRYVAEEVQAHGFEALMAEPADTAMLKSRKKRAKTDRADATHLRMLALDDAIPESWIPPGFVTDTRVLARLYRSLGTTRKTWMQRVHAQLFQQGAPAVNLTATDRLERLAAVDVSPAGRILIDEAIGMVEYCDQRIVVVGDHLRELGRTLPGPVALQQLWGVGSLLSPIIWAELGDTRRFGSSRQAVRFTGLDITVHDSDNHRRPGVLARQGSPVLRWALVEAAQHASKPASPDHDYYQQARQRLGASRAGLSVARKIARRSHHILKNLGDDAWQPIT